MTARDAFRSETDELAENIARDTLRALRSWDEAEALAAALLPGEGPQLIDNLADSLWAEAKWAKVLN